MRDGPGLVDMALVRDVFALLHERIICAAVYGLRRSVCTIFRFTLTGEANPAPALMLQIGWRCQILWRQKGFQTHCGRLMKSRCHTRYFVLFLPSSKSSDRIPFNSLGYRLTSHCITKHVIPESCDKTFHTALLDGIPSIHGNTERWPRLRVMEENCK